MNGFGARPIDFDDAKIFTCLKPTERVDEEVARNNPCVYAERGPLQWQAMFKPGEGGCQDRNILMGEGEQKQGETIPEPVAGEWINHDRDCADD